MLSIKYFNKLKYNTRYFGNEIPLKEQLIKLNNRLYELEYANKNLLNSHSQIRKDVHREIHFVAEQVSIRLLSAILSAILKILFCLILVYIIIKNWTDIKSYIKLKFI